MSDRVPDRRGFFEGLVGDGGPLLSGTGLVLVLAGAFALFQSATGEFLPQDVAYLGMTAHDLCSLDQCRIVHFMFHDRVSFGGSLIALGSLYLWMAEFPLRHGQPWAWWLFLISGVLGFLTFLAYLGYGYLDTWHGAATLALLPVFAAGIWRSRHASKGWRGIKSLIEPAVTYLPRSAAAIGRLCLLLTAVGLVVGGLIIMAVGMTSVFVPQDLQFMGLSTSQLHAINPRLIPLIAHDRAGFGGQLFSTGVVVFFCVWCAAPSPSLWQVICVAGVAGFGTAIGIHPIVGYLSLSHLAPAIAVAMIFVVGLVLSFEPMVRQSSQNPSTTASSPAVLK